MDPGSVFGSAPNPAITLGHCNVLWMTHSTALPSHLYSPLPPSHLILLRYMLDFVIIQNCSPVKWQIQAVLCWSQLHDCSISPKLFSVTVPFLRLFFTMIHNSIAHLFLCTLLRTPQHCVKSIARLCCAFTQVLSTAGKIPITEPLHTHGPASARPLLGPQCSVSWINSHSRFLA